MPSFHRLYRVFCISCRNPAIVVAYFGEIVSSRFIIFHTCSIDERTVNRTQGRARRGAAAACGRAFPCWKKHKLPHLEVAVSLCYQPAQYVGNYLLYPAETPNMKASCNWWALHHEAWGGACVSRGEFTPEEWRSQCLHPSFICRQNLLPLLKTTERHSTLLSTVLGH